MQSPAAIHFDLDAPASLNVYLHSTGLLNADETIERVARAGEGNMNFVARISTSQRSFVLKQSRPWVEKYPEIEAPEDRIVTEVAFYRAVAPLAEVRGLMPRLIGFDEPNRTALFEDLGEVRDYADLYDGDLTDSKEIHALLKWLAALHRASFPSPLRPLLANRAMRRLNHTHLFDFPLRPGNGLDLDAYTPGLRNEADRLCRNSAYVDAIHALGNHYLADGDVLLHGDFYPGSWVRTTGGPRVIDPEFAFFGPAEYDVGVCLAHLLMAGYDDATRSSIMTGYTPPPGFDRDLAVQFAGMEIMRRLIGVAQLPLTRTLEQKRDLLARSEQLVLAPATSAFLAEGV